MDTLVKVSEASAVLAELGIDELMAQGLLLKDIELIDARAKVADLRKEFIALLPVATEEQVDAVIALVRKEEAMPEGLRPNMDFRMTEAQVALVKTARAERQEFCTAHASDLLTPVLTDVTQKLRSFIVRQSPKKVVTVARWEKAVSVSAESRSLIARLAKATQV